MRITTATIKTAIMLNIGIAQPFVLIWHIDVAWPPDGRVAVIVAALVVAVVVVVVVAAVAVCVCGWVGG